jgi:hypothetical protein
MWSAMLRAALRAVPANGTTHLKRYFKGNVAIVLHFRKPANRLDQFSAGLFVGQLQKMLAGLYRRGG